MPGIVHGQRTIYVSKDGKRKRIICDGGVVPLVKRMWGDGFETVFSCEGSRDDPKLPPYVAIRNTPRLHEAHQLVQSFWSDCIIAMDTLLYGNVIFYALPDKRFEEQFMDALETKKNYVIKGAANGE